MKEAPLSGGRNTAGVRRVGNSVRRPWKPNSHFVRSLLAQLEESGFDAVPRYLGRDEYGREVFSFLPGDVPRDLDPEISDEALMAAAHLIRRFHDATAGTKIAATREVVCHNDLSPCNFVFQDGRPVGIIDFDSATPGQRLEDLGYAIFLWLNLWTDGPPATEQARRIQVLCRAYGIEENGEVIDAIVDAVTTNVDRLRKDNRVLDARWWAAQLDWLKAHQEGLLPEPG